MPITWNPFTDNLDFTGTGSGGTTTIPEYASDPSSPSAGTVWVLHTQPLEIQTSLFPLGIILEAKADVYKLSYRTSEGTTKRVLLS